MIILIADDDRLIRFTMKSMLHDILDAQTSCLEAANGLELVDLCQKHMPDIAFVDIKMPYMDGITAIERCKEFSPDTEFVIISGYSDFEYAKRCIPLQIREYLLKPVEEEALARIVSLLQEKLSHNRHQSNSNFHLSLLNAFNFLAMAGAEAEFEEPVLASNEAYDLFGIFITAEKKNQTGYFDSYKGLIGAVSDLGRELLQFGFRFCLIYSNEGTPYCMFQSPDTAAAQQRLFAAMGRILRSCKEDGGSRYLIYGREHSFRGLFALSEVFDECHYLSMNFQNRSLLSMQDFHMTNMQKEVLSLIDDLLAAFSRTDETVYTEKINTLYRMYKDKVLNLNLGYIAQFAERMTGNPVQSSSFKAFCHSFIDMAETMYLQVEKTDETLVNQIKAYIQKNYMNDLSISQTAEKYNLTPNYLSSLFHQQEGCKLIDYITAVRLNNAKRILLENSTASVKDVAVMVGYTSSRHFSTIFQKSVGVTPSGYRKG